MLTIGTHRITFTVTDSQGNKANDTIIISVTPYFEITSVAPSKTVAGQGFLTPINVTITNLGPITQTINVTICANMTPSAEEWDEFWSMGDVNRNGFIDDVDIALVTAAFGSHPGDPNWNPAADVNSDGVVNMKDLARLAHNYGKNIWDYFGLSPPPIGMQNVNLSIGDSKTMTFTWNTTGSAYGNYSMWAYAEPVEGETIALDYTFVDGQVVVSIPGDLDGNFAVDIYDAILLAGHFNQTPLSPSWNANVDINGDGIVDIFDAILLAKHFNQHYP
jgi:hypothetical protein